MTVLSHHISEPTRHVLINSFGHATTLFDVISFHFIPAGDRAMIKAYAVPVERICGDGVVRAVDNHRPLEIVLERSYPVAVDLMVAATGFEREGQDYERNGSLVCAGYADLADLLWSARNELVDRWGDDDITLLDFIREYTAAI